MPDRACWIAERREAGEAFVIAGDFNRRLAVPGDWAWKLLREHAPTLSLSTEGRISRCDGRYLEYIDHLAFNPGGNVVKRSILRLINPGDGDAEVTIAARDDFGDAAPEGDVTFTLPAGEARDLSAQALESGAEGFDGRFGDGEGRWRLAVSADRALHVLNLVRSRRGYLASLSQ